MPRTLAIAIAVALVALGGCARPAGEPELVWGKRGVQPGDMVKPRAAAIDATGRLYLVDYTARIQAYDRDGHHLGLTFTTPDYRNGRPSGLSITPGGDLLVSDSHYHAFRIYAPDGTEKRLFQKEAGTQPGQLAYVADAVQDDDGNFYVAEFCENERISKFDRDGNFLLTWGEGGMKPGQFSHLRALVIGPDGLLYAVDACNHRVQVFTRDGKFVRAFGEFGDGPGQMSYPYDLAFGPGPTLYVVEHNNHRVQKFTPTGESLGVWGGPGRKPGQLHSPWAIAVDGRGRVHVIDSENHRVQRINF